MQYNPATLEAEVRELRSKVSQGKSTRKNTESRKTGGMAQVRELLPSKLEALSSNPKIK
jgi:hypothetical protein